MATIPEQHQLPEVPVFPGSDYEREPIQRFRAAVAVLIGEVWGEDPAKLYAGVDTGKRGHDLALAIPRFKKGKPDEWGKKVVEAFKPSPYLASVQHEGAFLTFEMNKQNFAFHMLNTINEMGKRADAHPESKTEAYGTSTAEKGKKFVCDFSSPNIAKPFHAGHLRSTIIGAVICNLHEAMGWDVTRLNYLGDWGTQYGLLSIGFDRYGDEEKLAADPIRHLFEVYVKVNQDNDADKAKFNAGEITDPESTTHAQAKKVFKAMEDGEPKALAQWSRFRELSIKKLKETYKDLNVEFDNFWGESKVKPESMQRAIDICQEKGLTCEDRGALLVDLKKWKMDRAIIRKADGTTIYLTRDLGGAHDKYEMYNFDKHTIVTAAAQQLHFKQMNKTLELMGEPTAGKINHVSFGTVHGMSTRKGTVVFLDDILTEAKEVMHQTMRSNEAKYAQIEDPEETARIIGSTAVKIQDLTGKRINDYTFDIKRCTSFEGDFGPFIQYSHVRLCSVERKNPNVAVREFASDIDVSVLDQPKIHEILYNLALYPDVVKSAYKFDEPSTIVTWCFKISHLVGSAWENVKVSGAEQKEAEARLFLYTQIRRVLNHAMRLLSLTPIERM